MIAAIRIIEATGVGANELLVISAFTLFVKVIIVAIYWDEFSLLGNNLERHFKRKLLQSLACS